MNTEPTPYAELNDVLVGLVTDVQAILERTLVGAYLQGSFALGDGDMQSDCDFLFVLREEPSPGSMRRSLAFVEHAQRIASGSPWV